MREQARVALGARCDVRAYHHRVLGNGAVPLALLRGHGLGLGGDRLLLRAPLIITEAELAAGLEALGRAVRRLAKGREVA